MLADKKARAVFFDDKKRVLAEIIDGRIVFAVKQSIQGGLNNGSIKIYGLGDNTVRLIADRAKVTSLYAGRGDYTGLIGTGDIVSVRKGFDEGMGAYISISFIDGDSFMFSSINHTVAGNISLKQLAVECIKHSAVNIETGHITDKLEKIHVPRGAVLQGSPIDVLKGISSRVNAMLYIRHGFIYIICEDEQTGAVFNLDNNLFLEKPYQVGNILSVCYDIEAEIMAGRIVLYDGNIYRVQVVDIKGDTGQKQWQLNAESKQLIV